MSLDATRWAWCCNVTPSQKLLLLSLADRADEYHRCCLSFTRLSKDTGIKSRMISTLLRQLCEGGFIIRVEGRYLTPVLRQEPSKLLTEKVYIFHALILCE